MLYYKQEEKVCEADPMKYYHYLEAIANNRQ